MTAYIVTLGSWLIRPQEHDSAAVCLQIKGSKHIELFHSDWCQQIYPFTTMVLRNTSQVRHLTSH
jgi:hypothetical protein